MYSLPSTTKNSSLIISYSDVMYVLEEHVRMHTSSLSREFGKELDKLLETLIFSYFSQYSFDKSLVTSVYFKDRLEDNLFHNFENSEIGLKATLMIIDITKHYLPGFNSHEQNDCGLILNMSMINRCNLKMEVQTHALYGFVQKKPFYS
jgi:hypothetical protein